MKNLSPKARRFAETWQGDGVAAARAAGYAGSPAVLAVTASRLLDDERVRAIIAARGLTPPPRQTRGGPGSGRGGGERRRALAEQRAAEPDGGPPSSSDADLALHEVRKILKDQGALPRDKLRAAETITKLEAARAKANAEQQAIDNRPVWALLAPVLRARRARERERGKLPMRIVKPDDEDQERRTG